MSQCISRMPVLFVGHGAGPMFVLPSSNQVFRAGDQDSEAVKLIGSEWGRLFGEEGPYASPNALVVVSAHWESDQPGQVEVLDATSSPKLLFDYYGFPQEAYQVKYPCPTDPKANKIVLEALSKAGVKAVSKSHRERGGFDHGVFIPLKVLYPPADLPVVQVSLDSSLNPEAHVRLGAALQALRDQGMLIIASGMTVHNLGGLGSTSSSWATDFQQWLDQSFSDPDPSKRRLAAVEWEKKAPKARMAHPREEHLLPFFVADAAGGGPNPQRRFLHWMAGVFPLNLYIWH